MQGPTLQQLNPKLQKFAERWEKTIDLTIEKVVAHHENPRQYPLPGKARSLERLFADLFEHLPIRKKNQLIQKANKTLKASSSERSRVYGDLAGINLRSAVPMFDQVKALPVPAGMRLTKAEQKDLAVRIKQWAPQPKSRPRAARAAGVDAAELVFTVQNLTCVRPTDLRKDEVSIAPFVVDNLGNSLEAKAFFVGNFKKGDTLPVTDGVIQVSLNNGQFPKTFVGGFLLIEQDLLRNSPLVLTLRAFLLGACVALITAAGALIPGAPATGPLIGALGLAGLLSGVFSTILGAMSDDLASVSDVLIFDGPVASETVFDRTLEATVGDLKGRYQAAIDWIAK